MKQQCLDEGEKSIYAELDFQFPSLLDLAVKKVKEFMQSPMRSFSDCSSTVLLAKPQQQCIKKLEQEYGS